MRPPFNLSVALAAGLGLSLMLGCNQQSSTTAQTEPTTPVAEISTATIPTTEDVQTAAQASPEAAAAQALEAVPPAVFAEDNIAIRGADPVAYFTEDGYVAGTADYTYEWAGATWQFASAENRDLFANNPQQYAPQYGGFCAWAVSQGYTASIDPTAWKIVDNKLYLNYDARIQRRWQQDIPGNIAQANQNWPGVLN